MADRLDLPGDPRGPLAVHVLAPEGPEALDEPARRIDLQVLALPDRGGRQWADALVTGAGRPIGLDTRAKIVLAPHLGVGRPEGQASLGEGWSGERDEHERPEADHEGLHHRLSNTSARWARPSACGSLESYGKDRAGILVQEPEGRGGWREGRATNALERLGRLGGDLVDDALGLQIRGV